MHIALPCILSCHTYDELKSWLLNGHRAKIWVGSVGVGGLLGGERWCGRRWVHCHPPARPPTRETRMKSFNNNNNNKTFLRCYSYHNPPTYTRKQILHGTWHSWEHYDNTNNSNSNKCYSTSTIPLLPQHPPTHTKTRQQRQPNDTNNNADNKNMLVCYTIAILPPARETMKSFRPK